MTTDLFREDSYLKRCEATVTAIHEGGVELDRTVFYYTSGGQPGDVGTLTNSAGQVINVTDTYKDKGKGCHFHKCGEGIDCLSVGDKVTAEIDWKRRYSYMKMHTCLHLLCSVIKGDVTGGGISDGKCRLDFDLSELNKDKESISAEINLLIKKNIEVKSLWISEKEMSVNMNLVRTLSVKPPTGQGRVRLINIEGVDLQPCGGTHVKVTGEIGQIRVGKIENKGKHNRRINMHLAE